MAPWRQGQPVMPARPWREARRLDPTAGGETPAPFRRHESMAGYLPAISLSAAPDTQFLTTICSGPFSCGDPFSFLLRLP